MFMQIARAERYRERAGGREGGRAVLDFPRMRDVEIRREQGIGLKRLAGSRGYSGLGLIAAPSGSKSWKRIGSNRGGCAGIVSLTRAFPRSKGREHMHGPLRYFMDRRSRPLIKPNITSEGLSKLLREMN